MVADGDLIIMSAIPFNEILPMMRRFPTISYVVLTLAILLPDFAAGFCAGTKFAS